MNDGGQNISKKKQGKKKKEIIKTTSRWFAKHYFGSNAVEKKEQTIEKRF